jgi:hypothetical protein
LRPSETGIPGSLFLHLAHHAHGVFTRAGVGEYIVQAFADAAQGVQISRGRLGALVPQHGFNAKGLPAWSKMLSPNTASTVTQSPSICAYSQAHLIKVRDEFWNYTCERYSGIGRFQFDRDQSKHGMPP